MKKKTPKEYEQLGKAVASIFESGYLDKKQAYKTSFLKGIAGGLGGVIGVMTCYLDKISSIPIHHENFAPLMSKSIARCNKLSAEYSLFASQCFHEVVCKGMTCHTGFTGFCDIFFTKYQFCLRQIIDVDFKL